MQTAQIEGILMTHSAQEPGKPHRLQAWEPACEALQMTPLPSHPALGGGLLCLGSGNPGSNSVGDYSSFSWWADGSDSYGLPRDVRLAICGRTRVQN